MERSHSRLRTGISIVLAVVLWALFFFVLAQRQAIADWWKLRGYTPPASVSAIARTNTMTDYATHLFYVNKPTLMSNRSEFAQECPVDVEKTIVLGCYQPNDNGIFLYNVSDERLKGVVEVTAAHEMLHAAYERLSDAEKKRVDSMLQNFAATSLADERLKKTFQAYKDSGADVTNEMHSIIGTEVATLPAELESYYSQYFADRQAVVRQALRYEAEFTSREARVTAYDVQLASLKRTIDSNKAELNNMLSEMQSLEATMDQQKAAKDYAAYNANVAVYNAKVDAYNALLKTTKQTVEQYNALVDTRNALASEEQALVESLSGSSLPSSK